MGKKRWWGEALEKLKADYENPAIPMVVVAKKHKTSLGQLANLVNRHGWTPRRLPPGSLTIASMKARKRLLEARLETHQRELTRINQRLNFLDTVNRRHAPPR